MYEEHDQLDSELARLAQSLRGGDLMMACLRLAEFALKLDRCIRREERVLSLSREELELTTPNAIAKIHAEHAGLRRLVALIASALDRADDRRALEVIGKLRSVLLLHLAKEESLMPLAARHV